MEKARPRLKIRPRARLKDVAEAAGFSANTVSLALRESPRIPEETRRVILKEAERLNYFPNQIARSLASRATRTIGLVMTDIMNPTLTLAARTIERQLSQAGYGMMFAASDSRLENEKRALTLFQSYQVDGILIYPADHRQLGHIRAVSEAGFPVLLLADLRETRLDVVAIDDQAGGYKAASHLLKKGHQKILMLDGGRHHNNSDKQAGVLRALAEAGLSEDSLSVINPASRSAADGFAAMEEAAALDPRPTALFASTDQLALGALRWCQSHGLAVPEDMAIIGYDNTENAAFCDIPLTTINYASDDISRLGVERILARIAANADQGKPTTTLIEPDLIVRQSA